MLSPLVIEVSPGRLFTKEFAYNCRPAGVPKTAAALVDETGVWSISQPAKNGETRQGIRQPQRAASGVGKVDLIICNYDL
jgi:hypothetical protein